MSLKNKTVGGVKWTSLSAISSAVLQLLQIAVLTRFLSKGDFGLMAMAIFVIGISAVFIDMGLSNAIIHKQKVNKYQLSTLFWLNGILGAIIYIVIFGLSPWIALFYDSPELKTVINWASISFLIQPWGQQFAVLLKRDFRFKSLAISDIAAKIFSFIVGVALAYLDFGVYALVFANLASVLISTGILIFLGLKDSLYRPKFKFALRSVKGKGFFSFGLFQMGEKLIYYFNTNFDTLIIGKILGIEVLGLYEVAKNLAFRAYLIINPIITKVAFPALAKVQDSLPRIKKAYLQIVSVLSSVNAPLHFLMILLAEPLLQLLFGREWIEAVPVFQLLVISALCSSVGNPVGALQLAMGRADLGFYWNLGRLVVIPLVIFIGAHYGIIGVAASLAIFRVVTTFYLAWKLFIKKLTHATYLEYFHSFSKSVLLAFLSSLPTFVFLLLIATSNVYIAIIGGGCIYGITHLFLNLKFNKRNIIEAINIMGIKPLGKLKYFIRKEC